MAQQTTFVQIKMPKYWLLINLILKYTRLIHKGEINLIIIIIFTREISYILRKWFSCLFWCLLIKIGLSVYFCWCTRRCSPWTGGRTSLQLYNWVGSGPGPENLLRFPILQSSPSGNLRISLKSSQGSPLLQVGSLRIHFFAYKMWKYSRLSWW